MKIKLYIGAHKTATTHIQNLLNQNRSTLLANNTFLSIPSDLRTDWLPLLFEYSRTTKHDTLEKLRALTPTTETWLIAEENLPGVSNELRTRQGIYCDLEKRLTAVKNAYPEANIEIYFSLRSYESFYRSAYLEVVRNKGYFPFEEFYDSERFKHNTWVSVIGAMARVFRQDQIYLWRYEDFTALLPSILKHLTSLPETVISDMMDNYKTNITRPSISAKTLKLISSNTYNSIDEAKAQLERLNNHYPANEQNGYYKPFDEITSTTFKAQYQQDIQAIATQYPGINLLSTQQ